MVTSLVLGMTGLGALCWLGYASRLGAIPSPAESRAETPIGVPHLPTWKRKPMASSTAPARQP